MNLLTLDLGVTTGWAWFAYPSDASEFLICDNGTVTADDLGVVLPQLRNEIEPDNVVMEKPVIIGRGQLAQTLHSVIAVAEAVFPTHDDVTPAQWKPTPSAKYPLPRGTSVHVRDAIRLGVWWLNSAHGSSNVQS